jgi:hypothetical protein
MAMRIISSTTASRAVGDIARARSLRSRADASHPAAAFHAASSSAGVGLRSSVTTRSSCIVFLNRFQLNDIGQVLGSTDVAFEANEVVERRDAHIGPLNVPDLGSGVERVECDGGADEQVNRHWALLAVHREDDHALVLDPTVAGGSVGKIRGPNGYAWSVSDAFKLLDRALCTGIREVEHDVDVRCAPYVPMKDGRDTADHDVAGAGAIERGKNGSEERRRGQLASEYTYSDPVMPAVGFGL